MPCLEITTVVGCPLRCNYCPQDKLRATYGNNEKRLSVENFKTILQKVPGYVRIDFSGMSEPFAVGASAVEMIGHTLERGYHIALYTTLVGLHIPAAADVIALLRARPEQVEVVCLHLPDKNGNMRGFHYNAIYETVLDKFIKFGQSGVLSRFEMMTMDRGGEVDPRLKNLARLTEWMGLSRAGTLKVSDLGEQQVEETPHHTTPVSCSYTPFYDHNVVLPNGDVVLCCMDYSLKHKIGNLLTDEYHALFASPVMAKLRADNLRFGEDGPTICKKCSRAKVYDLDLGQRQFWKLAEPVAI
jgi:sulfatase maturation enzyme AslB (radical SAM superfamily)